MLHVTNGDCAARRIEALGLGGEVLPWRDVLHEGPVPAPATLDSLRPLRARFLAPEAPVAAARDLEIRDRRLGASAGEDEVALWFEHDLYDQLQLAQILDWYADHPRPRRLTLAQASDYLGEAAAEDLRRWWDARTEVGDDQLAAARAAWRAFASPDPRAIEDVLDSVGALPFLRPALARHLEEFPDAATGLSRTERQALEALDDAPLAFPELFDAAHRRREGAMFLGDTTLQIQLAALAAGSTPFVTIANGTYALTDGGREALAGRRDRVESLGLDRWLGGVHLRGRRVPFRWDSRAARIVASYNRSAS